MTIGIELSPPNRKFSAVKIEATILEEDEHAELSMKTGDTELLDDVTWCIFGAVGRNLLQVLRVDGNQFASMSSIVGALQHEWLPPCDTELLL